MCDVYRLIKSYHVELQRQQLVSILSSNEVKGFVTLYFWWTVRGGGGGGGVKVGVGVVVHYFQGVISSGYSTIFYLPHKERTPGPRQGTAPSEYAATWRLHQYTQRVHQEESIQEYDVLSANLPAF